MRYLLLIITSIAAIAQPYNGTMTGSLTYTTGNFSQGLTGWNASTAYVTVPTGALPAGNRAIGFWVKSSATGPCGLIGNDQMNIFQTTAGNMTLNVGGTAESYAGTINDGTWHHVLAVFSGTAPYLFKDGVTSGNAGTASATAVPGSFDIGKDRLGNPSCAGIVIDDVSTWDSTGTVTWGGGGSVIKTTNFTAPTTAQGAGTRGRWPLDGNVNDTTAQPLSAPALITNIIGIKYPGAQFGSGTYPTNVVQVATLTGSTCGTYADVGASQSGAGPLLFAVDISTVSCVRVKTVDSASATAFSPPVYLPAGGRYSY